MAEELNPAEEAENTVPTNEGTENTEATASESVEEVSAPVEEEVSAEEPLELYSTADDAAFMDEKGEFSWEAYESAGGYTASERDRIAKAGGYVEPTLVGSSFQGPHRVWLRRQV